MFSSTPSRATSQSGAVVIALHLAATHRALLHLDETLSLRWVGEEHLPFLRWHREHVFKN